MKKEFKLGDKVIIKGIIKPKLFCSGKYPIKVNIGDVGDLGGALDFTTEGKMFINDKNIHLFHDNTEVIDKIVQAAKELLDADWSDYIKKAGRLKEALDDYL